jgi:hypothetical protein
MDLEVGTSEMDFLSFRATRIWTTSVPDTGLSSIDGGLVEAFEDLGTSLMLGTDSVTNCFAADEGVAAGVSSTESGGSYS